MKKYLVFLMIPLFMACGREAKMKVAELQAKTDSLIQKSTQKDVEITDFMNSVNDVQGLLDSIKTKENIISMTTQQMSEANAPMKNKLRRDITAIYDQMLKDRHQLSLLTAKLKSSGTKMAEFQKLVDHLQQEIAEKDKDMTSLHDQLSQMDIKVNLAYKTIDTLNNLVQTKDQQINSQVQTINDQTVSLNTAYYILGTSQQLTQQNIIKRGKVLPDFNRTIFKKIDIRNVSEIPIDSKKVKLLSNHPSGSYKLVMDGKKVKALDITDEKGFWSNTKYLILAVN
jgi:hypothetical protein